MIFVVGVPFGTYQGLGMNFSAGKARRKWACRGLFYDQRAMVTFAAVWFALSASSSAADTTIPLPRPRPTNVPAVETEPADTGKSAVKEAAAAPPSACRVALTDAIAIAPSVPAITGPGGCGGDDLVRLEAVVLPDKGRVPVKPAAILRCGMASAIADWIRTDMAPLASGLGTTITSLDNFDSFECRGRNRVAGARMSEHGRANALDVRALTLANGQSIALTDRVVARDLREKVLGSVCARFTTVLGPGSDGYHEDHIHLDLAERRNGYRICHWEVYDPMPVIAPLLPAERPEEAPPRDVASNKPANNAPPTQELAAAPAEKAVVDEKTAGPKEAEGAVPLPAPKPAFRTASRRVSQQKAAQAAPLDLIASKPAKRKPKRRRSDLPPFLRRIFE